MKPRKLELGDRNIIGKRVTEARLMRGMKQVELLAKLQLAGIDLSVPALSLLEGQKRPVSDIELNALADILNVSAAWLLGRKIRPHFTPKKPVRIFLCARTIKKVIFHRFASGIKSARFQ